MPLEIYPTETIPNPTPVIRDVLNSQFYAQLFQRLGDPIESAFQDNTFAPMTDIVAGDLPVNHVVGAYTPFNLVTMIVNRYETKWKRVYNALYADYNPIHNYDLNESGENFKQIGGDSETYQNYAETKTGTEKTVSAMGVNASTGKTVDNIEVGESGVSWSYENGDSVKTSNYVTTYDSSNENLNDSIQQQGQSSTISTTQGVHTYDTSNGREGTVKHSYDGLTYTVKSPNSDIIVTPTEFYGTNLMRSGNIGITTTQKMITDEIILRSLYNFATIIINDCVDFCSGGVWI